MILRPTPTWWCQNPKASDDWARSSAPWNLDRIDPRAGKDGVYNYGNSIGTGAVIYVFDTGLRIDHVDFGGRARPGYSVRCCMTPNNCQPGYLYQGVIDSSSSTCNCTARTARAARPASSGALRRMRPSWQCKSSAAPARATAREFCARSNGRSWTRRTTAGRRCSPCLSAAPTRRLRMT